MLKRFEQLNSPDVNAVRKPGAKIEEADAREIARCDQARLELDPADIEAEMRLQIRLAKEALDNVVTLLHTQGLIEASQAKLINQLSNDKVEERIDESGKPVSKGRIDYLIPEVRRIGAARTLSCTWRRVVKAGVSKQISMSSNKRQSCAYLPSTFANVGSKLKTEEYLKSEKRFEQIRLAARAVGECSRSLHTLDRYVTGYFDRKEELAGDDDRVTSAFTDEWPLDQVFAGEILPALRRKENI